MNYVMGCMSACTFLLHLTVHLRNSSRAKCIELVHLLDGLQYFIVLLCYYLFNSLFKMCPNYNRYYGDDSKKVCLHLCIKLTLLDFCVCIL